jgi:hypothetical protein
MEPRVSAVTFASEFTEVNASCGSLANSGVQTFRIVAMRCFCSQCPVSSLPTSAAYDIVADCWCKIANSHGSYAGSDDRECGHEYIWPRGWMHRLVATPYTL